MLGINFFFLLEGGTARKNLTIFAPIGKTVFVSNKACSDTSKSRMIVKLISLCKHPKRTIGRKPFENVVHILLLRSLAIVDKGDKGDKKPQYVSIYFNIKRNLALLLSIKGNVQHCSCPSKETFGIVLGTNGTHLSLYLITLLPLEAVAL